MNPLLLAATEIQQFCAERGWKFCLIGGVAAIRWGRERTTRDVDVSLLTGFDQEERFIDAFLQRFKARRPDARDFALHSRVLIIQASNGVPVDIALAGLPFEQKMIERSNPVRFAPKLTLQTATPEDIVITKAFAGRHRDWNDVEGILVRQRGKLDWDYILRELRPLCELKEAPEIVDELLQMRAKIDAE